MKVCVFGGGGFIGQHVQAKLRERGHEPMVFDRRATADFLGDVTDPVAVTEALAHADGFIHLAACLGTQEMIRNPRPAATTNIMGTLNVLEAAAQYDRPGAYIGVGNWWMLNSYSISKTCAENYTRMFNLYRGGRTNIVRAMNAYGEQQSVAAPFGPAAVRKIVPAFVCRALTGQPIEVYGDGEQISDMVYVGDVALALVRAVEYAAVGDVVAKPVEVGPKQHTTVNQVADLVNMLCGGGAGVTHLPMRPGEQAGAKVTADTDTLPLLGMDARYLTPIREGLARTIGWFRENEGVTWQRR